MLILLFNYFGWCYVPMVADGIATHVWCGRCYYHLADVIANAADVAAIESFLFQFKFCDVV